MTSIHETVDHMGNIRISIGGGTENRPTRTVTYLFKEGKSELFDREIEIRRIHETEKAIQFLFLDEDEDDFEEGGEEYAQIEWIPKSQITIVEDGRIELPEWLAKKKGIAHFANKKEVWDYTTK